ncbi:hypothetical protein EV188_11433 [Actinomycetospora succinea]|uniref:Uncharacterized protein n=1 Tax=Actinomycetospora succinea TaxID=663603 RepID=A0A4R6UP17_9PSEU|nr:hypothetical protein [Actinomycetospora succinea]TDQ46945.1 hypothetical protein EV188_11433 [Actinomycetospora succinea]
MTAHESSNTASSAAGNDGPIRNPLWVISLFLGLCEVVAGTVTALTFGLVQIVFAFFVVSFPLLVAGAFFYTLWSRPMVFYAPRDYPDAVEPMAFAKAVNTRTRQVVEVATDAALASVGGLADSLLSQGAISTDTWTEIERESRERVQASMKRKVIDVDFSALGAPRIEEFLVTPLSTVASFLDDVWFLLDDDGYLSRFPAHTYGERWVLQDTKTGHIYWEIGGTWAAKDHGNRQDSRSLGAVGVQTGDVLRVVDLNERNSEPQADG